MPSYDYRCEDCKKDFTVDRSMLDESPQHCTLCGSEKASRIWNVFILASGGGSSESPQAQSSAPKAKSGCGSCSSHACGTCH